MIEVQIRHPCGEPELADKEGLVYCSDCGLYAVQKSQFNFKHRLVTEWVPLERAIEMAHVEAAKDSVEKGQR